MKRAFVILFACILCAAAAACAARTPAPTPTPAEEGAALHGFTVAYETIKPLNPGKAAEIKISLPPEMEQPKVVVLPGGGALALGQKVAYGARQKVESSKIMAARYDNTGKTLWTKVYEDLPDGYAVQIKPLNDGGFAFTMSELAEYVGGQGTRNRQVIVFCGADGHVAYHEASAQTGLFQHVLETDTGICVVGDAGYRDGKPVGDTLTEGNENALTLLAQGPISSVFFSRRTKADGYFSPMSAVWSKESGLVVAAYRDDTGDGRTSGIIAYDTATLTEKWRYGGDAPPRTIFEALYPTSGGTLVNCYTGGKPFIMKLAPGGKKLWEIAPDEGSDYAVISMAAYADGAFAAAINRYKVGDAMRGVHLARYDEQGGMKKKVPLRNETVREVMPLDNGGLITVGTQNKKVLPAPAYVSAIWFDTETIVTCYDKALNVRWRKVYDKYPDSTRQDIAVPTADGRVIIEG